MDRSGTSTFLLLLALCVSAMAQSGATGSAAANLLGPHNDGARGCMLCHAPESALTSDTGANKPLWSASVALNKYAALEDAGLYAEIPTSSRSGRSGEVAGVLLCLSCHDGNLTPYNMMQSWSYEHQVGILGGTAFSEQKIPSLLGREEAPLEDHPVGPNARIHPGNGLVFSNGTFSVVPNSPYAQFVANYGWPSLAPVKHSSVGVTNDGEPFTLCTTCHDQHLQRVYVSGEGSPIEGDAGGKFYTTYFFVNGPYDPKPEQIGSGSTTRSSAQFCRQCHFDMSNEGNNVLTARTLF